MIPHRNFYYLDGWVYWTDRTNQIWYLRYIVGNIFCSILSLEAYWQHMFNIFWNLNINSLRPENPIHPWPDGAATEWFGEGRDFIVSLFMLFKSSLMVQLLYRLEHGIVWTTWCWVEKKSSHRKSKTKCQLQIMIG